MSRDREADLELVLAYHERTKHQPHRYAAALGYLDWDTQPDPYRVYEGAERIALDPVPIGDTEPGLDAVLAGDVGPARAWERAAVSQLFHDSLAISARKRHGTASWELRVNPSSGNLHPTEGWLVAGPVSGLFEEPGVFHYAVREHALERRRTLPAAQWERLTRGLPSGSLLVALTSIWWREAWKYGERAFRYCQHDAGHAIAALSVSASILGFDALLLEGDRHEDLAVLLGVHDQQGPEAEHPEAWLALVPRRHEALRAVVLRPRLDARAVARWRTEAAAGTPNRLSSAHHDWPILEAVAAATERQAPAPAELLAPAPPPAPPLRTRAVPARRIVRRRRSAVAMDGRTAISAAAFLRMLACTLPGATGPAALPWSPRVQLVLFVHRVDGLSPGLYVLARDPQRLAELRGALRESFAWRRVASAPAGLELFLLAEGDLRALARFACCHQEIAADGAFAVAMLGELEPALRDPGPWFYRELHQEAGAVGQALYLAAEAEGVRATGIGCFFDDVVHEALGLEGRAWQTIYCFTVGGAVEDPRLVGIDEDR